MPEIKRIGIIYNFRSDAAIGMAQALHTRLAKSWDTWLCATNDDGEKKTRLEVKGTDVLVTVGGDGTILKSFRMIYPSVIPILGVNTGMVGFMTEIDAGVALSQVPRYLSTELRTERRATITGEIIPGDSSGRPSVRFHALNDIVVGRRDVARVAHVETKVNGGLITTYRTDGVIVSTATGSTGYALACGGPIMYPESQEMLLVPVSPHLSLANPLLVPPDGVVELKLVSQYPGLASADGQVDHELETGDTVRISRGQAVVLFLRDAPPSAFYSNLTQKLQPR